MARVLSNNDFRRLYLDGDDDPRVGGNTIPFEALQYLDEEDIEACVLSNPDGVVDLLMDLRESFDFNTKDDESFRATVLGAA